MALSVSNIVSSAKTAISSIDYKNGAVDNDEILTAIVSAIIDEITANAEVEVTGGSSAGTYKVK